jgi:hypothetical protein
MSPTTPSLEELTQERDALRLKLGAIQFLVAEAALVPLPGCGDSACMLDAVGGMTTNGGCQCLQDLLPRERWRLQRALVQRRSLLATLKGLALQLSFQPAVMTEEERGYDDGLRQTAPSPEYLRGYRRGKALRESLKEPTP